MNKIEKLLKENKGAVEVLLETIKEASIVNIADTELYEQIADTIVAYTQMELKVERLYKKTKECGVAGANE